MRQCFVILNCPSFIHQLSVKYGQVQIAKQLKYLPASKSQLFHERTWTYTCCGEESDLHRLHDKFDGRLVPDL